MVRTLRYGRAQQIWRAIRLIFWAGLWLLGLSLSLLFPVRWLSGDYLYSVRLVNYVLPWLLLLLLPAVVVAGLARRKWLLTFLTLPAVLVAVTFVPLFLSKPASPDSSGGLGLKIVSQNMFYKRNAAAVIDLIRRERPDVLLLQEFHPGLKEMPLDELAGLYPKLYVEVVDQAEAGFSAAVVSRYPISWVRPEFDHGRTQKVRIETPKGPIEVWNVHPFPPYIYAPHRHDRHLQTLAAEMAAIKGPLIVAGDFNITAQSAAYSLFSERLSNAHDEAGRGFGFTFPAPPHSKGLPFAPGPLYRIDHIFYNEFFVARDAQTLELAGGSDHLPIMADLMMLSLR